MRTDDDGGYTPPPPKPKASTPSTPSTPRPPAAPVPTPTPPLPAPTPPPPTPIPGWDPSTYNPFSGLGNVYGGPLQTDANGNLPTWYAQPPPAPSYNPSTGVTAAPTAADVAAYNAATAGQIKPITKEDGTPIDNPYALDLTTNGLGVLLQTAAAQLDPTDISDPVKRRAILTRLGASDLEIRDLSYAGIRYDSELESVNNTPTYTRPTLNKIATLRVLASGKVVTASATNTGAAMTAGEYYWRNTLSAYQAEQAAKLNGTPRPTTPLPKLPVRAAPTASSSGGTVLTILAIGAAVLALS
jgi:hypothetical protein